MEGSKFKYNGYGLYANLMKTGSIVENTSFFDCAIGFSVNNINLYTYNCASFDNSSLDYELVSNATGNNNVSSDATVGDGNWSTGSDNQINLVATDEFKSLIQTNAGFLLPKTGSNINGGGKNPSISGHTTYFNGADIVLGDVDIGAKGLARGGSTLSSYKNAIYKNAIYRLSQYKNRIFR